MTSRKVRLISTQIFLVMKRKLFREHPKSKTFPEQLNLKNHYKKIQITNTKKLKKLTTLYKS